MALRRQFRLGLFGCGFMVAGFAPLPLYSPSSGVWLAPGVTIVAAAVFAGVRRPTWAWAPALLWLPWYAAFFVHRLGYPAPGLSGWPAAWGWLFGSIGAGGVLGASFALHRPARALPLVLAIVACVALFASLFLPALKGPDSASLSTFQSSGWATRVVFVLFVVLLSVQLFAEPASAGMTALFWLGVVAVMLFALLPAELRDLTTIVPAGWIAAFTGGMLAFTVGLMARLERRSR
jgi:hypothetical protein